MLPAIVAMVNSSMIPENHYLDIAETSFIRVGT